MLPYWIMLLFPALVAIASRPVMAMNADGTRRLKVSFAWIGVYVLLVLGVGFRFEVGGDWFNYFRYLAQGSLLDFADLGEVDDPGYMALNILSADLGFGMTGVHVLGAMLFGFGLVVFLRSLPRPWLGLACAVPYLVIVVGMGYTRQGIALGLVMVGLVALRRQKYLSFAIWVFLGALFHKSAVLIIPVAALTADRLRLRGIGLLGLIGYIAYDGLLAEHTDRLVDVYIEQQLTDSQGAFIRLAMNAVPAMLFMVLGKRFLMAPSEYRLWRAISLISIAMFVALLMTGFTTALDRMALYFIPLQLVVFAHLPDALGRKNGKNTAIVSGIIGYYAAVLFVWLNFATHSQYWLPYKFGLSLSIIGEL